MEIVVINKDGSYLTFGQMVLRETLKFCFSGFFIISIIMMLFTEKK